LGYSLRDVARILKVSPGRLRYWQRTELVQSLAASSGEDDYAFRDLVVLRAILSLIDKGIPLQRIRRNLEMLRDRLPELDDPAAALRIFDDVSARLVVRHAGRLEEAGGQLLLEFEEASSVLEEPVARLADFEAASGAGRTATKPETANSGLPETIEVAISWFERGCNLGAIRYNQGQRVAARRAFESCLEREADHVEANFNLANVLEESGEDAAALAHYRRALASDPLYPDLHINLALLYEKIGRPRPGLDHWRRYLQIEPDGSWAEVARRKLDRASDQA
jgi:DNA-binding transcriptional MerR regulator